MLLLIRPEIILTSSLSYLLASKPMWPLLAVAILSSPILLSLLALTFLFSLFLSITFSAPLMSLS